MDWYETYEDMLKKGIIRKEKQGDKFVKSYRDAQERLLKFAGLFTHGALYGLSSMAFDDTGESLLYSGVEKLIFAWKWADFVRESVKVVLLEQETGHQCYSYQPIMPSQN